MIVAMRSMRVVQVAVDEIVDVIAVGDGFVAATGAVLVVGRVTAAAVGRGAVGRVGSTDGERVLFDGSALGRVVQMAVVQVVGVPVVLDAGVPASGAVLVRVPGVCVRRAHRISFSFG
jgi:hypothetical protein